MATQSLHQKGSRGADRAAFRVGKVKGYLRGSVWYLCYFEQGQRRRPRVGHDLKAAKTLAAQINGQLASSIPSLFAFDSVSVPELRQRWLEHHEHVLRSSLATIGRDRTATEHSRRSFRTQTSIPKFEVNSWDTQRQPSAALE